MLPQLFMPSVTLFLLGIALRISLRLLYGARGPAADDAVYRFMAAMSWLLLVVPTLVFLIAATHWVTILLFIAVFEAVVELVVARRQAHRESAWKLLIMALGSGRPLAESLRYHEDRFRGIVGRWFRRLVADLDRGAPVVEAVWANRRALPREASAFISVISAGDERSIARLGELDDMSVVDLRQHTYQRFAYLATVATMAIAVLTFVIIKIVPSYQEIYADFDLELPAVTRSFIAFSESFGPALGAPIVLLFFAMLVGGSVVGILYLCDIPILRPLTDVLGFSQHGARVLRMLATLLEQGAPLGQALAVLMDERFGYPSPVVQRRLFHTATRINAGHEWTEAMRRSSLITAAEAALLRTAQEVGNLPWAMRMLAERKLRLMNFRWSAIINLIFAALVLLIGLVVFWYAVAMFVPIVDTTLNLAM
jgi:type II secretory pathway component PulF